jgi:hypothetical protein
MHGIAEIQMFNDGRRVGGVMIHVVAARHLAGPSVAAAINTDQPVTLLNKE